MTCSNIFDKEITLTIIYSFHFSLLDQRPEISNPVLGQGKR